MKVALLLVVLMMTAIALIIVYYVGLWCVKLIGLNGVLSLLLVGIALRILAKKENVED